MQEIEVSARLYQANGAEFMSVTVVNALDSDDPRVTPITFVLKGETLVTVRFKDPKLSLLSSRAPEKPTKSRAPRASKSCLDCWRP
jgi:magnesium transporter